MGSAGRMTSAGMAMANEQKNLNILGIRGYPASHGGFETFAARLAPYLIDRGWSVNVYCQVETGIAPTSPPYFEDDLNGIHRIHVGVKRRGPAGTIEFDLKCTKDVLRRPGLDLVLGYNTAVFSIIQRLNGRRVVMNMDGIEWKRAKWSLPAKAWFLANEFIGAHVCSTPIADHPEIGAHLRRIGCRRSVVIPYGSDLVMNGDSTVILPYGVSPHQYFISIARIEPENSTLEIVRAFSLKSRGCKLLVLGNLDSNNKYHREVRAAASSEVIFPGPIYNKDIVEALRLFCIGYLHGHQVGGTNPSLVEALGCGCPVIAHDNRFNRWVAGNEQLYFTDEASCSQLIDLLSADQEARSRAEVAARARHARGLTWETVLLSYEKLLDKELCATDGPRNVGAHPRR